MPYTVVYGARKANNKTKKKKKKNEHEKEKPPHIGSILQTRDVKYIKSQMYVPNVPFASLFYSFLFSIFVINFGHDFPSCSSLALKIPLYLLCIYSIFPNISLNSERF